MGKLLNPSVKVRLAYRNRSVDVDEKDGNFVSGCAVIAVRGLAFSLHSLFGFHLRLKKMCKLPGSSVVVSDQSSSKAFELDLKIDSNWKNEDFGRET